MTTQIKLNRCKHCNGIARIKHTFRVYGDLTKVYQIHCRSCQVFCEGESLSQAAERWNARMPNNQSDIIEVGE